MTRLTISTSVLLLVLVAADRSAGQVLNLPIGDPERRARTLLLGVDVVMDTSTGESFAPDALAARLAGVRLLLIGESHTSAEAHRVQARVIEALANAGRPVLIGLEMFPYTEQAALELWSRGDLAEADFVRRSRWYEHWGYHWGYYREIFHLARDRRIPLFAVNTPRRVVAAVRQKGLENLSPEEAMHVPARIDLDSADHLTLFKAYFSLDDATHSGLEDEAWRGMLAAQATWDAMMAYQAVRALEREGRDDAIMVVLAGSGHVAYGLGIERQARAWFDGGIATLIPVTVPAAHGTIGVQASYANYIWGVPPELVPAFPSPGLTTRLTDGDAIEVIAVEPHGLSGLAGVQRGDVVLGVDGQRVADREELHRRLAEKRWGDAAELLVGRDGSEMRLQLQFRRMGVLPVEPRP